MKTIVIGAGGVGGYYGAVLARAGHEVGILARGESLAAIRRDGIRVRGPDGQLTAAVQASDRVDDLVPADLVLVAVKSYSLGDVMGTIARAARDGATVLPLLNGVDIAERLIGGGVPADAVLGGLTYISAARVAPGQVERRSDFQRIVLGEREGGRSERAEGVARSFGSTPVAVRVSDDIQAELWEKFVFISALSAACGLARAPIGAVRDAPLGEELIRRAVAEVAAVARARGIALSSSPDRVVERILGLDPALRPSFLLDLERGGPTELDVLSGTVSRLGAEEGVATPVHDTAWTAFSAATVA